jgi:predicted transcriptional regulator
VQFLLNRACQKNIKGMSGTEVARRLGVTQAAGSQAAKRGAKIIEERYLKLKEDENLIFLWTSLLYKID